MLFAAFSNSDLILSCFVCSSAAFLSDFEIAAFIRGFPIARSDLILSFILLAAEERNLLELHWSTEGSRRSRYIWHIPEGDQA